MDWVWIIGGLFCAWATLRVIGAERIRMIEQMKATLAAQPPANPTGLAASAAGSTSAKPANPANSTHRGVRSKAGR